MISELEYLYQNACLLFELGEYDSAVEQWIDVYINDKESIYKADILKSIYNCFIIPNEQEFQNNYLESSYSTSYDDLPFDFIPVNESKYYYYDRNHDEFGVIDLKRICNVNTKDIRPIIVVSPHKMQEMYEKVSETGWSAFYYIRTDDSLVWDSLAKIAEWNQWVKERFVYFDSIDCLIKFFEENKEYLPKIFVGDNCNIVSTAIDKIHNNRIYSSLDYDPILTVYIPTYNRGDCALWGVKHILKSEFDYEIEIVVSDNCSECTNEEYNEISKLSDSRLSYYRSDCNTEFYGNIKRGLELARGRFILFISDEDHIDLEHLSSCINSLVNNEVAGVFYTNYNIMCEKYGVEASQASFENTYISGTIYNKIAIEESNACELLSNNIENYYVATYPHCFVSICATRNRPYVCVDVPLIVKGDEKNMDRSDVFEYAKVEQRITLLDSFIKIYSKVASDYSSYCGTTVRFMETIIAMLVQAYKVFPEKVNLVEYLVKYYSFVIAQLEKNTYGFNKTDADIIKSILTKRIVMYISTDEDSCSYTMEHLIKTIC